MPNVTYGRRYVIGMGNNIYKDITLDKTQALYSLWLKTNLLVAFFMNEYEQERDAEQQKIRATFCRLYIIDDSFYFNL